MVRLRFVGGIWVALGFLGCSGSASGGSSGNGTAKNPPASPSGGGAIKADPVPPGSATFGPTHTGSYHLGPVDFAESMWPNSCAPYPKAIADLTGPYLAGVDVSLNGSGELCDACALITTRLGKQVLVRIVTTGVSNAAGDIDLSPEAYALIHEEDPEGTSKNPRPMTWQLARCGAGSNVFLQYQTEANPYWTSLWVRNARMPVAKLEVRGQNRQQFFSLERGMDGTFTDTAGFGEKSFELRVTSTGGQSITQTFQSFAPGAVVEMNGQFD